LEAIAERGREHAGSRRGSDQRELLELEVDRAGVDSLAEHDVQAKILHRRVEVLFHRLGNAMDLVDEQDGLLFEVRQVRDEVLGRFECRAAGGYQRDVELAGDAVGKGSLAQSRRAVEEDVPQRLPPLAGRIDDDVQPLDDLPLADHVAHPLRAQLAILVVAAGLAGQDRFAGHAAGRRRRQSKSGQNLNGCRPTGNLTDVPFAGQVQ
jgi:hypothetical protein